MQNGKRTIRSQTNSSCKRPLLISCWLQIYGQESKAGQRCIICRKCTEKDCPCTVNTRCNLVKRFSKNHNPPAPSEINVMKFMAHIKERARTSLDPKLYENDIIQFRSQEWDDDTYCRKDTNFCFLHMISTQKTQHRTSTTTSHQTVCYFIASNIFHLYHDENKLIFHEMMMRSALY